MLWWLLLVPLALAAYVLAQRRRARYAVRFTNLDVLAGVVGRARAWPRHLAAACLLAALAAMLIGLARPQATVSVPAEQATIVLVMDTSASMRAEDVQPSRMVAAQRAATTFVDQVPRQFRVGLIAFADAAQTLTAPTTDRTVLHNAVASLQPSGGTAIGSALQAALASVQAQAGSRRGGRSEAGQPPPAAIVLLSDGASTSGPSPVDVAATARQRGVPVFTIALGSDKGSVADLGGLRVPVPPDPDTLRQVAEATGGRFFAAPDSRQLQSIYQELGSRVGFVRERQEVTAAFAAAALGLLLVGGVLGLLRAGRLP
jgi:Ca-activated chloride channel family protein